MNDGFKVQVSPSVGSERIGLIGWLSLYVSGALLVVFIVFHIIAVHFVHEGNITAQTVNRDLRSGFLSSVSIGLLLLAAFHGLMGLRRVILDLELFGKKGDRALQIVLTVVGVVIVAIGIEIFRRFTILA
jgi:succinate dehydrogenase hydrophobic anchor subunit